MTTPTQICYYKEKLYVPQYGVFLLPANQIPLSDELNKGKIVETSSMNLEKVIQLPGTTQLTIEKGIGAGILSIGPLLRSSNEFLDEFNLLFEMVCGGKRYSIRRSDIYDRFSTYVLSEVNDGIEGNVLAQGFGATNWKAERNLSVIDGVWAVSPKDNVSRLALYWGIEGDMCTRTTIIRLCSEVKLPKDTEFFRSVGYREMERNAAAYTKPHLYFHPGRIEWVKLLKVEKLTSKN